ncbi:hypothetical protein MHH52_08675 [Paenibacillus sp. FSL K6-0276]|uniref:hypothetical protein n=1 Tax=Paenibacillus sp. FSL K6-0276 TaxID=2921450 RepID=UPI0030EDF224
MIDRIRRGLPLVIHGDGTSLWTLTHNSDFAKGFVGLLGHPEAIGEAIHIFITAFSPPETADGLIGDQAISSVFDNSKIKRYVPDFQATVPFSEGVKQSVAWFETHPDQCTVDSEWSVLLDTLIEKHGIEAKPLSFYS